MYCVVKYNWFLQLFWVLWYQKCVIVMVLWVLSLTGLNFVNMNTCISGIEILLLQLAITRYLVDDPEHVVFTAQKN